MHNVTLTINQQGQWGWLLLLESELQQARAKVVAIVNKLSPIVIRNKIKI